MSQLEEEIAKRLRTARKAAGYKSAKEFAIEHHIPLSTYSHHETGKRSINAELIIAYSSKLQVHPNWLLTGEKSEKVIKYPNYSSKNLDILKKIFLMAESLFIDQTIKLSYQEIIDYCFEVYELINNLTANDNEKEKIIHLTISSLKRGMAADLPKYNNKFAN